MSTGCEGCPLEAPPLFLKVVTTSPQRKSSTESMPTIYVLVRESPRAAGTELRFASKPCAGDKAAMDQWCAVLTRTSLRRGLRLYALRIPARADVLAAQGSRCTKVPHAYQFRACRTYRVPWHHRWRDTYNASRTPAQLKREGKVVSVALTEQLAHEYRRFRADQPSWLPLQPPAAVRAVAMVEADEPEAAAAAAGGGDSGGGKRWDL